MKEYTGIIMQASNKKWLNKQMTVSKQDIIIGPKIFGRGEHIIERAKVKKVKLMSSETSSNKTAGGTIGGAVVGGLLTGGIGAIVGGMAMGNHQGFDTSIAFELDGGEWFVVRWASKKSKGMFAEMFLEQIETIQQHYMGNPFAEEGEHEPPQPEPQQQNTQSTEIKEQPEPEKKEAKEWWRFAIHAFLWIFGCFVVLLIFA